MNAQSSCDGLHVGNMSVVLDVESTYFITGAMECFNDGDCIVCRVQNVRHHLVTHACARTCVGRRRSHISMAAGKNVI